jgi:hypothetical protein
MARWHYRDAALLWLLPPAFAAHVAEELIAGEGFRRWISRIGGGTLSLRSFLTINAIGFLVFIAGVVLATRREAAGWVAVSLATLVSVNAVLHALGTAVTGTYSPGLITGLVLYVPIGSLILLRAASQADQRTRTIGVAAGLAGQALVFATALALAR